MHELSIAQSIVDAVAERMGDERVTRVLLEVGTLSGVVVDSVSFCFDLVAEGTTVEGALLDVRRTHGHARCRRCDREFDVDDPILLCPGCDSADVEVLAGQELRIVSVEVSSACARPAVAPTPKPG